MLTWEINRYLALEIIPHILYWVFSGFVYPFSLTIEGDGSFSFVIT